ncbi:MAG: hypothetical protein U0271_14310 [Polyangiaceae bacterium]
MIGSLFVSLARRYRTALADEPKLRHYLGAAIIDDVGIAVSAWATMLMTTQLFTDQRERARLAIPALGCFLLGTLVSGPLADWVKSSPRALAAWRYRLVLWARSIETIALGALVFMIMRGRPTIGSILPYVMVSAFMKTALRPTRIAFEVDLLTREQRQTTASGAPLLDEVGAPRLMKTHLLTASAMIFTLKTFSSLLGLLLGGVIMGAVHGAFWPLFAFDVLTNIGFIIVIGRGCHPFKTSAELSWADTVRAPADETNGSGSNASGLSKLGGGVRHFGATLRDGFRFLAKGEQRPLLALLGGCWIVEIVTETYDGKMIVKQILGGSDDAVRYSELGWTAVSLVAIVLLPMLAPKVKSFGRLFLGLMLLDGAVITLAGNVAGRGVASAIVPFSLVLAADRGLTLTSTAFAELAQNSASSASMRGRIAALYAFFTIVGDILAEGVATGLAEAVGIPAMLVRVGLFQIGFVALLALVGGRRLWNFGLHTNEHEREVDDAAAVAAE